AKIPATLGLYPVFWLWHHDEIVVFEFFGNSTAHYLSAHNKEKYVSQQFNTVANYSDHFHTYATHWTPHTITWYFDDEAIHSISRADSDPAVKVAFPDSTNRWLRPHLSLRMYEWAERIDEANLPDTLKVDYIKIYQNKKI
ncbi:MAG: family 16 glycosylhydrolase, partial [Bacteroidota bacterium]